MNSDWYHVIKASMTEGPIKNVSREEMATATEVTKPGKAFGPSEVCAETSASGKLGFSMMMDLGQRVLDGERKPDDSQKSVLVPIIKGKKEVRNCNIYKVKL